MKKRPVGLGALCCLCGERRLGLLRSVELLGSWTPICHNCNAMVSELAPMPQSIAAIRLELRRDRRCADRRWGKRDSRVFRYNRRNLERREIREGSSTLVDDDMIVEISELVSDLEFIASESSGRTSSDLTCIQERPSGLES